MTVKTVPISETDPDNPPLDQPGYPSALSPTPVTGTGLHLRKRGQPINNNHKLMRQSSGTVYNGTG